jgi:hypothetical protein
VEVQGKFSTHTLFRTIRTGRRSRRRRRRRRVRRRRRRRRRRGRRRSSRERRRRGRKRGGRQFGANGSKYDTTIHPSSITGISKLNIVKLEQRGRQRSRRKKKDRK